MYTRRMKMNVRETLKNYGIHLNNLDDVYELLEKQYNVEWKDQLKNSFNLEFLKGKKLYRIYIDKECVRLLQQKKFFKFKYWVDITCYYYDKNENDFIAVYEGVINILKKYKKYKSLIDIIKEDIIKIYKEVTKKKCYKINFNPQIEPGILDSKLFGIPYLPIGEEYPVDIDGNKLSLFIQINLENVKLDKFPQKGVLQLFINPQKERELKIDNSAFLIKYYENITQDYQKDLYVEEPFEWFGYSQSVKLELKEEDTWMPIQNRQFSNALEQTISIYNKKMSANISTFGDDGEISQDIFDILYNECQKIEPMLLGGYSGYSNNTTDGGEECELCNKESLIKIVDNEYNKACINVIISEKDLVNLKFENAEIFYMW